MGLFGQKKWENQLLQTLQQGSGATGFKEAFTTLFREFKPRAVQYLLRQHRLSKEEAEDIVHQAFANLLEKIEDGKLHVKTSLWGYFKRIIINMTADWVNQRQHNKLSALPPEDVPSSEEFFISKEEKAAMERIINQLSNPKCRELLFPEDSNLSSAQLAEKLGYSDADAVNVMRHKCKKNLIDILKKEGYIKMSSSDLERSVIKTDS